MTVGASSGNPPHSDPPSPAVEIVDFSAPGPVLGGEVGVTLRILNRALPERTFWVGYSVRDGEGALHDVPSVSVTVDGGAVSPPIRRAWRPAVETAGPFLVVAAVWDAPPETGTATRLAEQRVELSGPAPAASMESTASTASTESTESTESTASADSAESGAAIGGWLGGSHPLGRGRLDPAHVMREGGCVRLRLPAGTYDGAQIASPALYAAGSFRAVMRTADAPGSLSAFFVYEDVPGDANDEADIEVMNDGSGRALLSLWCSGRQTHLAEVDLGFDPGAAAHEYRIDPHAGRAEFYVDGRLLGRITEGVPTRAMRVMANAWWPRWLSGPAPPADRFTEIHSIRISPPSRA